MTVSRGEAAKALKRLETDYKYFYPKEVLGKGKYRLLPATLQAFKLVLTPHGWEQITQGIRCINPHRTLMKRHIADYGDVNAAEWFVLIAQGYFENSNPDMAQLNDDFHLIDSWRQNSAGSGNHMGLEQTVHKAHRLAINRVRNLNRKVGKRGTAK